MSVAAAPSPKTIIKILHKLVKRFKSKKLEHNDGVSFNITDRTGFSRSTDRTGYSRTHTGISRSTDRTGYSRTHTGISRIHTDFSVDTSVIGSDKSCDVGNGTAERRHYYGRCLLCNRRNDHWAWCNPCDQGALVDMFGTWSTGNVYLDLFIQETQRTASSYWDYLEYIPYGRLIGVEWLDGLGDFMAGEVFTATWLDGEAKLVREKGHHVKGRSRPLTVSLEMITDPTKIDYAFISDLYCYYQPRKNDIYGITVDPVTMNYALVFRARKYGYCPQCKKANHHWAWCNPCDRKALIDKFATWSTGNKDLDSFIQETQRTAESYSLSNYNLKKKSYLEYVPYDRFTNVKPLGRGGFAKVFTATWLDGEREEVRTDKDRVKGRTEPFTVTLKMIKNSSRIEEGFINEINLLYQFYQKGGFFPCYGITQDPETMDYGLILTYFPDGDLRKNLCNLCKLTWKNKLHQLSDICANLSKIHQGNYIHHDIHSGNILIKNVNVNNVKVSSARLADFGLTHPADSPRCTGVGTYGVIPYMAPELFYGLPHSKESDIYAFGIVMSEIASSEPAFCDRNHDVNLQFEIIDGLRPKVPPETPECYKQLMDRCLSGNPVGRPTAKELEDLLSTWYWDCANNKGTAEVKQFKAADEQWKPRQSKERHPGAVYTSRFITHVTTYINGPVSTAPGVPSVTVTSCEDEEPTYSEDEFEFGIFA